MLEYNYISHKSIIRFLLTLLLYFLKQESDKKFNTVTYLYFSYFLPTNILQQNDSVVFVVLIKCGYKYWFVEENGAQK